MKKSLKMVVAVITACMLLMSCIPLGYAQETEIISSHVEFSTPEEGKLQARAFVRDYSGSGRNAILVLSVWTGEVLSDAKIAVGTNAILKATAEFPQGSEARAFVWDAESLKAISPVATRSAAFENLDIEIMVAGRPLEGFSKEKTEYTYDLADDGSMLVYPEVTAKVSDNSANVTVKTDEIQGKTTVTVEYGDRTTTSQTHTPSSASFNTYSKKSKTYTITYNIPSEYITNNSVEKSNTYQASGYNKQVLNKYNMRTRFEKTFTMTEAEKKAGEKQIDITTSWISGLSTLIVIPTAENVKTGAIVGLEEDSSDSAVWTDAKTNNFGAIADYDYTTDDGYNVSKVTWAKKSIATDKVSANKVGEAAAGIEVYYATQNPDGKYVNGSIIATDRFPNAGQLELVGLPDECLGCNYISTKFDSSYTRNNWNFKFKVNQDVKIVIYTHTDGTATDNNDHSQFTIKEDPRYAKTICARLQNNLTPLTRAYLLANGYLKSKADLINNKSRRYDALEKAGYTMNAILDSVDVTDNYQICFTKDYVNANLGDGAAATADDYTGGTDEDNVAVWTGKWKEISASDVYNVSDLTMKLSGLASAEVRDLNSSKGVFVDRDTSSNANANGTGLLVSYSDIFDLENSEFIAHGFDYWRNNDYTTKKVDMYSFNVKQPSEILVFGQGELPNYSAADSGWIKVDGSYSAGNYVLSNDENIVVRVKPNNNYNYNMLYTKKCNTGDVVTIDSPGAAKVMMVFVRPIQ